MDETRFVVARGSSTPEVAGMQIGRASVTRNALQLPLDATEEECETLIEMLSYLDDATPWWRGDAILQAENLHGEKYAQWVDILHASEGYLRNLCWVCSVFPPEDRHPGLSYKHHQVVASVKDRETRLKLLDEAYRDGLTAAELYDRVKGRQPEQQQPATTASRGGAPQPVCAVCGSALDYRIEGDKMLISPCGCCVIPV